MRLTPSDRELLLGTVSKRNLELAQNMTNLGQLNTELLDAIEGLLLDKLTDEGLSADGEPNASGIAVDDLFGRLRRAHIDGEPVFLTNPKEDPD